MIAYKDSYLPIDPDFMDVILAVQKNSKSGKVHFFNPLDKVDEAAGHIVELVKSDKGQFIHLSEGDKVRLDKIITLFGRPGPAYEKYDSYANACLACEDLGQFY